MGGYGAQPSLGTQPYLIRRAARLQLQKNVWYEDERDIGSSGSAKWSSSAGLERLLLAESLARLQVGPAPAEPAVARGCALASRG